MNSNAETIRTDAKIPLVCNKTCLAAQLTATLARCEQCITGTQNDGAVYLCMGKVRYLRGEYTTAVDTYTRAAAVALCRNLSATQLQRLRQMNKIKPQRTYEKAAKLVVDHEPTLVYHLGHAWHAATTQAREHQAHLKRYARGLRGLAPEAYDPALALLLHFHDQGVVALHQKAALLLAVLERYARLAKSHDQDSIAT